MTLPSYLNLLQDLGLNPQKASLIRFQPGQTTSGLHFGLRLGPTHTAVLSVDSGIPKIIKSLSGVSAIQVVKYENSHVILALGRNTPEVSCDICTRVHICRQFNTQKGKCDFFHRFCVILDAAPLIMDGHTHTTNPSRSP